jgi:hypothetical protein
MKPERVSSGLVRSPFPVYAGLVEELLAAHRRPTDERNELVAHVLGACAGYAYSDADTVATIMSRMGLDAHACVRIAQTVDAMFIYSTAYLLQSRCGRVVVLCYRGTAPAILGNWIGDADVGSETLSLASAPGLLRVHAGFHRNLRATRLAIVEELRLALQARSLLDAHEKVDRPLEALYITGHSLGGALAALFALTLDGQGEDRAIAQSLRAIYTFGQPLVVGGELPPASEPVAGRLFRHVFERDPVPALPPLGWGVLTHFGHEYRHVEGRWQRSATPVAQLLNLREIPLSVFALFATQKRRASLRYSLAEHGPHQYLAALRPPGRVTEFGDYARPSSLSPAGVQIDSTPGQ